MKKSLAMLVCAVLLCALLPLSGCSRKQETGAGYLFTCTLDGSPECLDPQYSDNPYAAIILANTMEGLMRLDAGGTPICAQAKNYTVSDDGLHYHFELRDDCYWYGPDTDPERPDRVTARDYLFAFKRLLDPAQYSPFSEDYICIKNAAAIIAGEKSAESLGVSAPDATTVEFTLEYPEPDFPALLARSCAAPCSQLFFESTNGRYGLDDKTVLCNGPFCLTKWVYDPYGSGNFITCRRSKLYYDAETVFPSSLQFNIMHSRTEAEEDFAEGNSDIYCTAVYPQEYLKSKDYIVTSYRSRTLGLIFNPDTALLQDEQLRQALSQSIDRSAAEEVLSEDMTVAYGVIPPGVTMLGRSYREMYADEQIAPAYDPVAAKALFASAAEQGGLSAMHSMQIMVPSNVLDTDALLAVCQSWQNLFGYYIGIETVSPEEYTRRLASGEYSIALWTLEPEENSCTAALAEITDHAALLGLDPEVLTESFTAASSARQLADSVALYGAAEQAVIDTGAFIPLFYKNTYLITTAGNQDIRYDPFTGIISLRDAKHFQ